MRIGRYSFVVAMQTEVNMQWRIVPCASGATPLHTFLLILRCCKSSLFENPKNFFKETVQSLPLFTGERCKGGCPELTGTRAPRPLTSN